MLRTKIRTALITLATVGVLSTAALPGLASAATPFGGSTNIPSAKIRMALSAGSAGVPGYDDATCQGLANDYNTAISYAGGGLASGDLHAYVYYENLAHNIFRQLTDNCVVIFD